MSKSEALNRHWEENRQLLLEAARFAGVDPQIMIKISGFESGFDPHARPVDHLHPARNRVTQFDGTMAISSAYGFGQFTDSTWLEMVHKYGAKYGVQNAARLTQAQVNASALRDDPKLQAAMLAEFTRDNVARGQRLGGASAQANVYALHNLGSGNGPRFLAALNDAPNARVDSVLSPQVISGNPGLYGDGSRTVSEAYRVMGAHMDRYSRFADHVSDIGAATRPASVPIAPAQAAPAREPAQKNPALPGSAAIYNEANLHFLANGNQFEYGRSDMRLGNHEGNGRTDASRTERDLDGDGLKGVDCSAFVWRGLKNAGYDVPNTPFTTHTLFNGHQIAPYSLQHFDVISATESSRDRGTLKQGDILLFKDKNSGGQHVGIFKGYDANGHIRFIGSQVSTGPAEAGAGHGTYWNGGRFEIVGALRAKPEFQVRSPLHAQPGSDLHAAPPGTRSPPSHTAAHAPRPLHAGDKGSAVSTLQRRLFELGYHGRDGKPLRVDGDFGTNTLYAVNQFQREHGLEGKGMAGPKTADALERAERALVTSPAHPQHALYEQALDQVRAAEKAKGIAVGPHSERVAAALTVECVRKGITQVDWVEISDDRKLVRAVHDRPGNAETGFGTTDMISVARAVSQPLGESSRQCHEVALDAATRAAAPRPHRQQATPAMAH